MSGAAIHIIPRRPSATWDVPVPTRFDAWCMWDDMVITELRHEKTGVGIGVFALEPGVTPEMTVLAFRTAFPESSAHLNEGPLVRVKP